MTIADLAEREPPYAKVPHALILSQPAPHVRLYGILHYLWWNHLTFEVGDLARMAGDPDRPVTDRTVYRWLDALSAAGWVAYDRKPGRKGLGERITLYTSPNGNPQTSDPDVRGCTKPLTSGSEVHQTSDIRIRGLAQPLTSGSEVLQTSDPHVRGNPDLPRPDAVKNGLQISGIRSPESDPESTTPTASPVTPSAGGGGGGDLSIVTKPATIGRSPAPATRTPSRAPTPFDPSPGAQLLASEGFKAPGIREFGHFPPELLAPDIARMRAEGTEPGGMVLYWRQFPPGTTPTSEAPNAANRPDRLPAGRIPPGGRRPEPAPRRETYAERRERLSREAAGGAPPAAAPDAQ